MAKHTIIDWQKDGLLVATASGRPGHISIETLSLQNIDREQGDTAADALKRATSDLGLSKQGVTVIAPRSSVEVRTINVPRVDADELPGIIRFQAQRQLANMSDSWALDYVMLPDSGQELRTALVGAMAPEHLNAIESTCTRANLQVDHIALRPIEIARHALYASNAGSKTCLILCIAHGSADLILAKQGQVVLVRNTNLPAESVPAALAGEIRRSLLAASSQLGSADIEHTILMCDAGSAEALQAAIAEVSDTPVTVVDLTECLPDSLANRLEIAKQEADRIAGICGAATLVTSDKKSVLDFKNPKKAPPKKSKKPLYIMAAVASLAVLVGGITYWYQLNNSLDQELVLLEEANESKKELVALAEEKVRQVNLVESFAKSSPNFLDELVYLTDKIPGSDKIILAGPHFMTLPNGDGQIRMNIASDVDTSISNFEKSIRDEQHQVFARNPGELDRPTDIYKWGAQETIRISGRGWDLVDNISTSSTEKKAPEKERETADNEAATGSAATSAEEAAAQQSSSTEAASSAEATSSAEGDEVEAAPEDEKSIDSKAPTQEQTGSAANSTA